jgi:hypothetical protein
MRVIKAIRILESAPIHDCTPLCSCVLRSSTTPKRVCACEFSNMHCAENDRKSIQRVERKVEAGQMQGRGKAEASARQRQGRSRAMAEAMAEARQRQGRGKAMAGARQKQGRDKAEARQRQRRG